MNPKNLLLLSAVVATLVLNEARVMRRREVDVPQNGTGGSGGSGDGKPKPIKDFASEICESCVQFFGVVKVECFNSIDKCLDRAKLESGVEPDVHTDHKIVDEFCCACDVIVSKACFTFKEHCDARTPLSKGGDESGESNEKDGESGEKDGEDGEKDGEGAGKDGESGEWDEGSSK